MMMDICVKIPQEKIIEAATELEHLYCLRKEVTFQLTNGKWDIRYTCGRFGNGYGVGFSCKDACPLRITDLDKCREIESAHLEGFKYLIQDEFFKNADCRDLE